MDGPPENTTPPAMAVAGTVAWRKKKTEPLFAMILKHAQKAIKPHILYTNAQALTAIHTIKNSASGRTQGAESNLPTDLE